MKEKIKTILIIALIGFIVFPVITFGASFVFSLIQGKTVEEAIQVLAKQMDVLIGRVETVETKQVEQEETVSGLESIIDQQEEIIKVQQNLIKGLQSSQTPQTTTTYQNQLVEPTSPESKQAEPEVIPVIEQAPTFTEYCLARKDGVALEELLERIKGIDPEDYDRMIGYLNDPNLCQRWEEECIKLGY